ncbi:hypothetical protein FHW16_004828 [Phyllobacterium myrsinacearum]|uniref:Secreted protein n=1 Tax=Phyllobacterium myrsinacearum TaxID=28101 RepID=A0A839EKV8_9HYPH|nr:hypothetical protein [Phyllobacterium myrsinacearum]
MRRSAILISAVFALFPRSLFAEEGVWSPTNVIAQINLGCTRVYTCGPKEDVVHDGAHKVVGNGPKLVIGVCSAGDGPIDSCNDCLTTPPTDACDWHLQPK